MGGCKHMAGHGCGGAGFEDKVEANQFQNIITTLLQPLGRPTSTAVSHILQSMWSDVHVA